jgi:hypothetical protein
VLPCKVARLPLSPPWCEAPIPTEIVSNGPKENLNRTVAVRRKAANRTLPWDLAADEMPRRTGKWTAVEDTKLKDAVQMQGADNWKEIEALVPGRTKTQRWSRWHDALNPCIDRANGRAGKWAEDEDSKLKDPVQTQGG